VPFKRNKQDSPRSEEAAGDVAAPAAGAAASSALSAASQTAVAVEERVADVSQNGASFSQPIVASPEKLAGVSRGRLGNLLIERNLVSEAQLEQGLAQQRETGGKIGEILVALGFLDDRDLVDTLSEFLGAGVEPATRERRGGRPRARARGGRARAARRADPGERRWP